MRIILADDQKEVRSGLKVLLEQEEELKVISETSGLGGLVLQASSESPDLVLLDWELASLKVSDIIPLLKSLCPGIKIIAMSGRPESQASARTAGADGFISKGEQPEVLLETLRNVGKEQRN